MRANTATRTINLTDGLEYKQYFTTASNDDEAASKALEVAANLSKETGREWRVISVE